MTNLVFASLIATWILAGAVACGGQDNTNAPFGPTPQNGGATELGGGGAAGIAGGMPSGAGGILSVGGALTAGGGSGQGGIAGGGGTFAAGGSGGGADGGVPNSGGATQSGGSSGSGSGGAPVTYPPLTFSAIGAPTLISGQFLFTEGPVWDPARSVLYFTDINADMIYELTLPSQFRTYLQPAQHADGLALDPQGKLIAAGFSARSIWRLDAGTMQTIAGSYQGKKLNSPDDLIARSDGVIYFTDPTFGINGSQGLPAQTQELSFQGVFRVTTDGTLHLEDQTTSGPNGVELSPDEQLLYVSYTSTGEVYTFAVAADGALSQKKLFANGVSIADSMCVDAGGNVYVASLGGIVVFSPDGTRLGTISVGQVPTNAAFGGPDQKTLFITARKSLIGTPTANNSGLFRIDNMPVPGMPGRP